MDFLDLPAELRLLCYSFLPDFEPGRQEIVSPHARLLPSICLVSRHIRGETVPIYAASCRFDIDLNALTTSHLALWMRVMGENGLEKASDLNLSKNWAILRPTRGQGHVGFYVRLTRRMMGHAAGPWACTVGTYPTALDRQGRRFESVQLLRHTILRVLDAKHMPFGEPEKLGLVSDELAMVAEAISIVARHPIEAVYESSLQEVELCKQGADVWREMQSELNGLIGSGCASHHDEEPSSVS